MAAVEVHVDLVDLEDAGGVAGAESLGDGEQAGVLVGGGGVALAVVDPGTVVAVDMERGRLAPDLNHVR